VRNSVAALFAVFLIVLFSSPVLAAYSVDVESVKTDIFRNESAEYRVTIKSFEPADGEIQAYTVDPAWIVRTDPLAVELGAGDTQTFTLYLRPAGSASFGAQGVTVSFRDLRSGSVLRHTFVLGVRDPNTPRPSYQPNVNLEVRMPFDVDPREPVPLRVELRNRNPLNLTNLSIYVRSPHFSADAMVDLRPLFDRTEDIRGLRMDPLTPPGSADVLVQIVAGDEVVTQITKNYRIMEYSDIEQDVQQESFFFKTTRTVAVRNDGNVQNTAIVSVPTSLIKSLFISSDIPHEFGERDGERIVYWSIPLDPSQSRTVTYAENYRILVLIVILAIAGTILYLILRSPLVGLKEAVAIARKEGVSEIKVRVFVRNRSARMIQQIQVLDRVPSLGDVVRSESPGSISPSKVAVSERGGTLLRWDLDVLEPFEERVLTYRVKSKLKIIGHMKLPTAKLRFTIDGKERTVYSNNIEILEKFKDR
jgi:hypothetical protein